MTTNPVPPEQNVPEGYRRLKGSERQTRSGAQRYRFADPDESILVSIYVRFPQCANPLPDMDYYATTPTGRRKFLSRDDFAAQYGAAEEDLKVVTDFAQTFGLQVAKIESARRFVQVLGTVAQLSKAFAVQLELYRSSEEEYRGHEGYICLPVAVGNVVEGVFGLDNRCMARHSSNGSNGNSPVTLTPPQVAKAYNFPTPVHGAAGQTIAILEFSGPAGSVASCGFDQNDIDAFINNLNVAYKSNLKAATVKSVTISGSQGNVPFGSATNVSIPDPDLEVALDIEVIVSVAQQAKVVVYFAPGTEQGWVDAVSQIATDSENDPSVLSISYGWPELAPGLSVFEWSAQTVAQISLSFQAAHMSGMTVLTCTGDQGANSGVNDGRAHVQYPSSDPWVTACGGTEIVNLSPLSEGTWPLTGGGVSYLFPTPPWQTDNNPPPSANNDGHLGRWVPDVAGNASPSSGYNLWLYGSAISDLLVTSGPPNKIGLPVGNFGGTSAVAPLYAALVALINASLISTLINPVGQTRVGYLNPALYGIGGSLGGSNVFRDINDGVGNNNLLSEGQEFEVGPGYQSGPKWDACTGWGSIDGKNLLKAFTISDLVATWDPGYTTIILTWNNGLLDTTTSARLKRFVGSFWPGSSPQETIAISPVSPFTDTPANISASPSSRFQYQLEFSNGFGDNIILSNTLQPPAAPATPLNVSANWVSTAYSAVSVTWDPVNHADYYDVTLQQNANFFGHGPTLLGQLNNILTNSVPTFNLHGHTGYYYQFQVSAHNRFGSSAPGSGGIIVPWPVGDSGNGGGGSGNPPIKKQHQGPPIDPH